MTATQSDSDRKISRRGVLRKATAVGVGSAATIGGAHRMDASPVGSASALGPLALAAGAAGAAGLGYLVYKQAQKYLGNTQDYSNYTGKTALYTDLRTGVLEMKSADERVMTSIGNNITNSQTIALAKGKSAAISAMNSGATESEANNDMVAAIDAYYSSIQTNVLNHSNAQVDQINHMIESVTANSEASLTEIFYANGKNGAGDSDSDGFKDFGRSTGTYTTLEGTDLTQKFIRLSTNGYSGYTEHSLAEKRDGGAGSYSWDLLYKKGDGTKDPVMSYHTGILSSVVSERDEVNSQLSGFISDVYTAYDPGEIPTEDLIDPVTAATELQQNTGLAAQAAEAAFLGIPTSAGFSLRLEIQDEQGNKYSTDAELYTKANPQDTDGNPTGFKIGNKYDPANFTEPIYAAYEMVNSDGETETDFVELTEPFTVLEATNSDGDSVDTVAPEPKITQTSDVSKIEEELAQLREEQQRLLEEQDDTATTGGAGAGFFSGSGPSTGAIAAGIGAISVLYALTQGGTS